MLVSGAVGMVEYCSWLSNGDALSAATGDGLHLRQAQYVAGDRIKWRELGVGLCSS